MRKYKTLDENRIEITETTVTVRNRADIERELENINQKIQDHQSNLANLAVKKAELEQALK